MTGTFALLAALLLGGERGDAAPLPLAEVRVEAEHREAAAAQRVHDALDEVLGGDESRRHCGRKPHETDERPTHRAKMKHARTRLLVLQLRGQRLLRREELLRAQVVVSEERRDRAKKARMSGTTQPTAAGRQTRQRRERRTSLHQHGRPRHGSGTGHRWTRPTQPASCGSSQGCSCNWPSRCVASAPPEKQTRGHPVRTRRRAVKMLRTWHTRMVCVRAFSSSARNSVSASQHQGKKRRKLRGQLDAEPAHRTPCCR